MLSEYLGGRKSYTILPSGEGDVDIVILDLRGRKPIIGYEVKEPLKSSTLMGYQKRGL